MPLPLSSLVVLLATPVVLSLQLPAVPYDARRLLLVRHGAVSREAHNPPVAPGALYGGDLEVPLSELGEAEAQAAAIFIRDGEDDVRDVWSSPMERALFGAKAIQSELRSQVIGGLKLEVSDSLREIGRGQWVNKTREQIAAEWGDDAFERCALEDEFGQSFGGEGMGELRERVLNVRDFLLKRCKPGTASVVVSHMWVTRILLADALGESNVLNVDVPTASISVIDYSPESWPPATADEAPSVVVVGHKPPLPSDKAHLADTWQAE